MATFCGGKMEKSLKPGCDDIENHFQFQAM